MCLSVVIFISVFPGLSITPYRQSKRGHSDTVIDGWLSDVSSNPIKGYRCFIEQETYPHILLMVGHRKRM